MGSKNHEVVPASLIASISGIRSGISNKLMGQLAKRNLIARVQNIKCASLPFVSTLAVLETVRRCPSQLGVLQFRRSSRLVAVAADSRPSPRRRALLPSPSPDDGYRLTYGGYDFLALRAMSKRDSVAAVGNQIGVGKESDIHITQDKDGVSQCLKLHRSVSLPSSTCCGLPPSDDDGD